MNRNLGNGYFLIACLHRDDLDALGFDVSNITDEEMEELVKYMLNDYLEQMYWSSAKILAEDLGFPLKEKNEPD